MNMNEQSVYIKLDLPASHRYLNVLGASLQAILERVNDIGDRERFAYEMELGVHETCSNIIEHAYKNNPGRIGVEVILKEERRQVAVFIHDTGCSFDLESVIPPDLNQVQTHGYGLFLVQELIDEVKYIPADGDNHWSLVKGY
jgi:serine/threonine-protein kinase RsbW